MYMYMYMYCILSRISLDYFSGLVFVRVHVTEVVFKVTVTYNSSQLFEHTNFKNKIQKLKLNQNVQFVEKYLLIISSSVVTVVIIL